MMVGYHYIHKKVVILIGLVLFLCIALFTINILGGIAVNPNNLHAKFGNANIKIIDAKSANLFFKPFASLQINNIHLASEDDAIDISAESAVIHKGISGSMSFSSPNNSNITLTSAVIKVNVGDGSMLSFFKALRTSLMLKNNIHSLVLENSTIVLMKNNSNISFLYNVNLDISGFEDEITVDGNFSMNNGLYEISSTDGAVHGSKFRLHAAPFTIMWNLVADTGQIEINVRDISAFVSSIFGSSDVIEKAKISNVVDFKSDIKIGDSTDLMTFENSHFAISGNDPLTISVINDSPNHFSISADWNNVRLSKGGTVSELQPIPESQGAGVNTKFSVLPFLSAINEQVIDIDLKAKNVALNKPTTLNANEEAKSETTKITDLIVQNVDAKPQAQGMDFTLKSTLSSKEVDVSDLTILGKFGLFNASGEIQNFSTLSDRRSVFNINKTSELSQLAPYLHTSSDSKISGTYMLISGRDFDVFDGIDLKYNDATVSGRIQRSADGFESENSDFDLNIQNINLDEIQLTIPSVLSSKEFDLFGLIFTKTKDLNKGILLKCTSCTLSGQKLDVITMKFGIESGLVNLEEFTINDPKLALSARAALDIRNGEPFAMIDVKISKINEYFPNFLKIFDGLSRVSFFSLSKFNGFVSINADNVKFNGYSVKNINLFADISSGILRIKNFVITPDSSKRGVPIKTISGTIEGAVDLSQDLPMHNISYALSGLDFMDIAALVNLKNLNISGSSQVRGSFTASGLFWKDVRDTMDGVIEVKSQSAKITGLDFDSVSNMLLQRNQAKFLNVDEEFLEKMVYNPTSSSTYQVTLAAALKSNLATINSLSLTSGKSVTSFIGSFINSEKYNLTGRVTLAGLDIAKDLKGQMPVYLSISVKNENNNLQVKNDYSQLVKYIQIRRVL